MLTQKTMTHSVYQPEIAMTDSPAFDGKPAKVITLRNKHGMRAAFMDIGATWLSCVLPLAQGERDVLLSSPSMTEFKQHSAYMGVTVGRFANRIANSRFTIDDQTYQVAANEGKNCLHGGPEGFNRRRWQIEQHSDNQVIFSLFSADNDQGFPGNLTAKVSYTLTDDNSVRIDYDAICDKTCPVNLTNHAYFNLAGESAEISCLEHELQIAADAFLRTGAGLIPTGELADVTSTNFDFRSRKPIKQHFLQDSDQQGAGGYDHAFVIQNDKRDGKAVVAEVCSPQNDVRMTVHTTLPSIQFYSGNYLAGNQGKHHEYANYAGLALETQFFPDGPNHSEWPEEVRGILPAGELQKSTTRYCFYF